MKSSQPVAKQSSRATRNGQATRVRILLAAEHLFAKHGFDGVSLRTIAAAGEAQLALLHYHFGSKLDLYRAIWVHRFDNSSIQWTGADWTNIDYTEPSPLIVRKLVERFISVPLSLSKEAGSLDFLAIVSRESFDPKAVERGLLKEFVVPLQKEIFTAFSKAFPDMSRREIDMRFSLMAAAVQVTLPSGEKLIGGARSHAKKRSSALLGITIDFIVGGWLQHKDRD